MCKALLEDLTYCSNKKYRGFVFQSAYCKYCLESSNDRGWIGIQVARREALNAIEINAYKREVERLEHL